MGHATEKPIVELRPAFAWDCPQCGVELFERGLVPEMADEDLHELREDHGVQPWDLGDFVEMPSRVQCPECGESFVTVGFREDER